MAHTALHFSMGMGIATAVSLRPLVRAWTERRGLAAATARWLALSYALGFYAIVPSLLSRAGCAPELCRGWWMNIFLLHPWLTALKPGGTVFGPLALLACFALQYLFLLACVRRVSREAARLD